MPEVQRPDEDPGRGDSVDECASSAGEPWPAKRGDGRRWFDKSKLSVGNIKPDPCRATISSVDRTNSSTLRCADLLGVKVMVVLSAQLPGKVSSELLAVGMVKLGN
jgi:hypothetical protein